MRTLILCLAAMLAAVSCSVDGKEKPVFLKSYILEYHDRQLVLYPGEWNGVLTVELELGSGKGVTYRAPEIGGEGENAARFVEIAERNGDRRYNRKEALFHDIRDCCANTFCEVHVVCLDKDWDALHPAGTPLDDVCEIRYGTYANFIYGGYQPTREPITSVRKRLTELTEDELVLLSPSPDLYFTTRPAPGSYTLKVRMIMPDRSEKYETCTLKVGVPD